MKKKESPDFRSPEVDISVEVWATYQLFTEVEMARGVFTIAAKRRGKFPPLPTDTEVNNCFSIY